jgi:regulator of sigma E protease
MNLNLLGGLTFVAVFAGIILTHELGHFVAARLVGIEVEEFGVGFPPRLLTLFTWKGTKFTLNLIPLGGFNRWKGEDDPEIKGGFYAAKPWKRLIALMAGSIMNLAIAVLAFSILYNQVGIPDPTRVQILDVSPNSPAQIAGLKMDDVVLTADLQKITSIDQFRSLIASHLDRNLSITVQRGQEVLDLVVIPDSKRSADAGATGVLLGNTLNPVHSWLETIPISFRATYVTGRELLSLPGRLIAGVVKPSEAQLLGPRSIWNLFQQSVTRDVQSREPNNNNAPQIPTNYTLTGIISLTLSLGIVNLLPIPALDGGRILFLLPELFFRKRISPKYESMIHGAAFLILIVFLGYFYIADFIHPVSFLLP